MSPATRSAPPATETDPLLTRSPIMSAVPVPLMVIAAPPTPPHPAWSRAPTVGVYRRLFTPPCAPAPMVGFEPLVRTRPNSSARARVAVSWNLLPWGPIVLATSVRTVPSEYVQVTVQGLAPGSPQPVRDAAAEGGR